SSSSSSVPFLSSSLLVLFSSPSLFLTDPATPAISTLSLHDALPIWPALLVVLVPGQADVDEDLGDPFGPFRLRGAEAVDDEDLRSEEHTSELQSRFDLVCRLLLEKKNKI